MESIQELERQSKKSNHATFEKLREEQRRNWLSHLYGEVLIEPMPGDASSRRYFRIKTHKTSLVMMDVPEGDSCYPFVIIANALRELNVNTPEIVASDYNLRFLLLSDFGHLSYLKALYSARNHTHYIDTRYQYALRELIKIQHCQTIKDFHIPLFQRDFMWQEWRWHQEWFLNRLLNLPAIPQELNECFHLIVESAASQPQIFMHRDYHSANLMVLADETVGVLDFQDAFIGPLTYDLVSLLRDCYIVWPKECVQHWIQTYWHMINEQEFFYPILQHIEFKQFQQWFDWMGIERHLKALFTFARKKVRDDEDRYLQYIPNTLNYIIETTQSYSALKPLHQYYREVVFDALKEKLLCAR